MKWSRQEELKVFFGVFGFESLPVIPNFHTINANNFVAKFNNLRKKASLAFAPVRKKASLAFAPVRSLSLSAV